MKITSKISIINALLAPNFLYDEQGEITGINQPLKISERDKKILFSYFWKVDANRKFALQLYEGVEQNVNKLTAMIQENIDD